MSEENPETIPELHRWLAKRLDGFEAQFLHEKKEATDMVAQIYTKLNALRKDGT